MKTLSIIETGYRATAEEQDDTIVWLNTMCRDAGLDLSVVLAAEAVNYGVGGHRPAAVELAGSAVATPPTMDEDLVSLSDRDVDIFYIDDDRADLGIPESAMIDAVKPIKRAELATLCSGFDQIWNW